VGAGFTRDGLVPKSLFDPEHLQYSLSRAALRPGHIYAQPAFLTT
jgi:hypothetical protein